MAVPAAESKVEDELDAEILQVCACVGLVVGCGVGQRRVSSPSRCGLAPGAPRTIGSSD